MPQPSLETELTEPQVEQLDNLVIAGKHTIEELIAFCKAQGWPSRSSASWTGYKRRAQTRAVERSITNGSSLRKTITALKAGETDETLKTLLELQGHIAMQLTANGTADPAQLKLAHQLTQLLVNAQAAKHKAKIDDVKVKQKDRDLGLDERKVALLEKKAAQADQAKGITEDKELTDAEKASRMKELFGIT